MSEPRWSSEAVAGVTALWLAFVLLLVLLCGWIGYCFYARSLEHDELLQGARKLIEGGIPGTVFTRPVVPEK